MEIELGSYIKVICKNGVIEAGKLIEYTSEQMVLLLIDKSYVIILSPKENVVAIRFSPIAKESRNDTEVFVDKELELDDDFTDEYLRAKTLAELHKMRAHEERKHAKELLQAHTPKSTTEVIFGVPDFQKPISKHPRAKTGRRS